MIKNDARLPKNLSIHLVGLMACAALICGAAGCSKSKETINVAHPPVPPPAEIRGIWVTRYDYRTERDVVDIIHRCGELGFNTVLFQVRGNGTAFYESKMEPWADELGGRNPGFDPLAVACREAHARNIALHAYINVLPAWRGTNPPTNPNQLYNRRPGWFWFDQTGRRQPLQSFYVSLNPCLPEVRRYIVDVCHDIVSRYDVDGLHLDYIRFPNEPPASGPPGADYPRDPRTVKLFVEQTGKHPDRDRAAWDQWRTDQITNTVRAINVMINLTKPKVVLSAAVGADPDSHRHVHFQDSIRWLREGLVDWVIPMNYTSNPREFAQRNQRFIPRLYRARLVPGLMVDRAELNEAQTIAHVRRQIDISRGQAKGYCLFAYSSLFGRGAVDPASRHRFLQRRQALAGVIAPNRIRLARSTDAADGQQASNRRSNRR